MLVTGVFWGSWMTLSRSINEFSGSEFIHIGKVIIANVANPMRVIMPSAILFLTIHAAISYNSRRTRFYLIAAALALMVVTLLITLLVEVPIDNQIKTWTSPTIPADWNSIREKWQTFHRVRTFTSIGGFFFYSLAIVKQNE
jgi:uncharacterized membrane protein